MWFASVYDLDSRVGKFSKSLGSVVGEFPLSQSEDSFYRDSQSKATEPPSHPSFCPLYVLAQ